MRGFDTASYFSDIADLRNSQAPVKPKINVDSAKDKGSVIYYFAYQYQDKNGQTKTKKVGGISLSWNDKALTFNIKGNCASYADWLNGQEGIPGCPVFTGGIGTRRRQDKRKYDVFRMLKGVSSVEFPVGGRRTR